MLAVICFPGGKGSGDGEGASKRCCPCIMVLDSLGNGGLDKDTICSNLRAYLDHKWAERTRLKQLASQRELAGSEGGGAGAGKGKEVGEVAGDEAAGEGKAGTGAEDDGNGGDDDDDTCLIGSSKSESAPPTVAAATHFTSASMPGRHPLVPNQVNGCDCGVYTFAFARLVLHQLQQGSAGARSWEGAFGRSDITDLRNAVRNGHGGAASV